jgi:polyhydroxybutyrate depolymerase
MRGFAWSALAALPMIAGIAALACARSGGADEPFHTTVPSVARDAGASTPSPEPSPTATATATTAPPGACGVLPSGVFAGQSAVRTLVVEGVPRSYRLRVPAGAASASGMPVVLNFHGLGSEALEQEAYSELIPVSDREGFVLVSPDGTGQPRGWVFGPNNRSSDDLAFVDLLIATLEDDLCIDRARVYSTGMSNGAFFSSLLGCVRSESIAAIAPVAGVAWSSEVACGRPMPVLAFHGVADGTVPFAGGDIFGVIPYAGAEANVDGWAAHNGCEPVSEWTSLTEHVYEVAYTGCEAETSLIAIEGGGHTWPGAIPVPALGPTTDEIQAAEMIWEFFADKALP